MSIKQSEVDSLHDGDVIELRDDRWPGDSVVRGPVVLSDYGFVVGPMLVTTGLESLHMTVVSRAPRPLYVNHPTRTEPVPGDVVRIEFDRECVVMRTTTLGWIDRHGDEHDPKRKDGLRLLVDGETGQVVP